MSFYYMLNSFVISFQTIWKKQRELQ